VIRACGAMPGLPGWLSAPAPTLCGDDFGSLFFGLRFFGEAKKGDCAAGRTSRPGMEVTSTNPEKTTN
jgi:hypothetical protein